MTTLTLSPFTGYGDLIVTRHHGEHPGELDGYVIVDHADPTVLLSDELLDGLHTHHHGRSLGMRLDPPTTGHPHPPVCLLGRPSRRPRQCWTDWLLRIEARNRTVIYRITTYEQERNAWRSTWPD